MSIASEEAEKNYPDVSGWIYRSSERRAYAAGRTAEVTDAETKAAVRAMYYRHAADWESDKDYARHLLEAARKAVME